jgi:hypothetical protein
MAIRRPCTAASPSHRIRISACGVARAVAGSAQRRTFDSSFAAMRSLRTRRCGYRSFSDMVRARSNIPPTVSERRRAGGSAVCARQVACRGLTVIAGHDGRKAVERPGTASPRPPRRLARWSAAAAPVMD